MEQNNEVKKSKHEENTLTQDQLQSLPSDKLEQEFVHQVYDQIAPHFSSTRYKV